MLPADIVGTRIYDAATATFRTEKGPVFTNILLADEINRATPKTQSALLEAMQERQVTLGRDHLPLEDPFWVLATQNPSNRKASIALPEAQLDRFSMMLRVRLSGRRRGAARCSQPNASRVELERRQSTPADVAQIRELIRATVHVDDRIREYIVRLGRATRDPADVGRPALREHDHCSAFRRGPTSTSWRWRASPRSSTAAIYVLSGRRQGDLPRRGAPPHRPQHPRRGRGRERGRDPRRDPLRGADPMRRAA